MAWPFNRDPGNEEEEYSQFMVFEQLSFLGSVKTIPLISTSLHPKVTDPLGSLGLRVV